VSAKALVPFAGKPLALHVLGALEKSAGVAECVYVGVGTPEVSACCAQVLPPGETLAKSLSVGLEAALQVPHARVLVTTADLPWLRAEAVDAFLEGAPCAALVYPVIAEEVAEAQFPGQRRTFVKLREGRFTGGNMMLLEPRIIPTLLPFVDRAYRGRKNPLALAQLFGFDVLVKLLLGGLSIPALEVRAGRILGHEVRVFVSEHASIGADVDKPAHLTEVPP